MQVLIEATSTPTGLGISYEGGDLFAFTGCCGETIGYRFEIEKWVCRGPCHEPLKHQPNEGTSKWRDIHKRHMDPTSGLYRWLSDWTGIPKENLVVEVR